MNKEIYYEGYLTKSPPRKSLWRAKWRRRWFTLKQGEIPGQFCLEYYTDQNCRKLKGVIDLDQCDQVDSGLRLEHRNQKFQYMFDIKTPKRIYYLAADTENDMKDWVNCICQVCNLHDLTKSERQIENNKEFLSASTKSNETNDNQENDNENSQTTELNDIIRRTEQKLSIQNNIYQNNDLPINSRDYTNRDTLVCDNNLLDARFELDDSTKIKSNSRNNSKSNNKINQSQCINNSSTTKLIRKIPENLVLHNNVSFDSDSNSNYNNIDPSPSLSTSSSSGPYIAISECFSGASKYPRERKKSDDPMTPLNNLDPKYNTTKVHPTNFNLTNDQSYSPKITNISQLSEISGASIHSGGQSTPTDSESVFTDEDESNSSLIASKENIDGSIETEPVKITYAQRFSKLPEVQKRRNKTQEGIISSNTADGKSHLQQQYHNINVSTENFSKSNNNPIAASTPNLLYENNIPLNVYGKIQPNAVSQRSSLYNNSVPSSTPKLEGNVFRFDFSEQDKLKLPPVNRSLKPKLSSISTLTIDEDKGFLEPKPPVINRMLKPHKSSCSSPSARRQHVSMCIQSDMYMNHDDLNVARTLPRNQFSTHQNPSNQHPQYLRSQSTSLSPPQIEKNQSNPKLQYVELDDSNQPPIPIKPRSESSSGRITVPAASNAVHVVYNQIDFLKTDAINKTRRTTDRQD